MRAGLPPNVSGLEDTSEEGRERADDREATDLHRRLPGASVQPAGCNLIAPELVDEWLQPRNALSIEIFSQNTLFRRSPRHLRRKAS